MADEQSGAAKDKDEHVPLAQKSSRAARREKRDTQPAKPEDGGDDEVKDPSASKRKKIDHSDQIN